MRAAKRTREPEPESEPEPEPAHENDDSDTVPDEAVQQPATKKKIPKKAAASTSSSRELADSVKPEIKYTTKKKQMDEFQEKIISLLENDQPIPQEDEIDMCFNSLSKRVKRALPVEAWDELIDNMNCLVAKHIQNFKKNIPGPRVVVEDSEEDESEEDLPNVHVPMSIRRPSSAPKLTPAVKISGEIEPMKPIKFYSVRGGYERQLEFEDL